MRGELILVVLVVGVLFVSFGVQAEEVGDEERVRVYSGFDRFVDNVKMFFSGGDNEVRLALEIREKEVDSAIINVENQGEDKAIKNLERAKQKLQVVQEKVSLNTSEEIKTSVDEITDKIDGEEGLPDEFDEYLLEEEKTQLTAVLTEKTFEYCTELAKEDFASMLGDEECNPETAIPGLEKDLEKLKDLQERMFVQLMLEIRSCVGDPGTCNCEANLDDDEKAKCEKMVALALRCEYKDDEGACNELKAMEPKRGDNFAESFVPDYLMNLFREKEGEMISYDMEPSDGVPEECWDYNDKPECRQYDDLKETKDDWDEYGNYIGKRPENRAMTMREAIPQCFEGDVFLEEKCGEITMVENEEGLINYLIGNEINGIIGDFENKTMQRRYAPGTSANGTIVDVVEVDEVWTVSDKVREIKRDMNQITNQIKNITYAPGTTAGGVGGVVVDGDDVAPGPDGIVGNQGDGGDGDGGGNVVDGDVAGDGDGGYAPGTTADGDGGDTIDAGDDVVDGDNVVDGGDDVIDGGTVDGGSGGGDVVDGGVDPGPDGIVGVVEGTGPGDD